MTKLESIQKGSQIIDQIFWELLKLLKNKQSYTEKDIEKQIKKLAKQMGAQGMAFPPIVSFGKSSAEIHHKPNNTKIGKNNFLMLDYGVKVNGYCSDFTRTLFLGQPNEYQEKIYQTVLKAYNSALAQVRTGVECSRIDLAARNTVINAGFPSYRHNTGHGLGRKIHEPPIISPFSNLNLPSRQIITLEPGIYLPGKFGVRIEDMIVVGRKAKVLSKVPRDFKSIVISNK